MPKQYDAPHDFHLDLDVTYTATVETNHGNIVIELDAVRSPIAANNFVALARDGFYDGVPFHRVISDFMIQGGDPTGTGRGGPGYKFRDELDGDGIYSRGTVAMANAGPNTNGSQFFIMHSDYRLPHSYTIFGKVVDGMDVVDAIAASSTDRNDRPTQDCVMSKVSIVESTG